MGKISEWECLDSEEIADCRVFKVRKNSCVNTATQKESSFFVLENPDWINIIPITQSREVVLIEQFRAGTQEITLEIPGGMVEENEAPLETSKRELLEETGFASNEIVYLGKSRPNPAIQNNWVHFFYATDCEKIAQPNFDEHEDIRTKLVKLDEIESLIENEKITHSLVLAGFYRLQTFLKKSDKYTYES